jgi:hypothetical protein
VARNLLRAFTRWGTGRFFGKPPQFLFLMKIFRMNLISARIIPLVSTFVYISIFNMVARFRTVADVLPEHLPNLEDPVESCHHQLLEVELRGNAQEELRVLLSPAVEASGEGSCGGPAHLERIKKWHEVCGVCVILRFLQSCGSGFIESGSGSNILS